MCGKIKCVAKGRLHFVGSFSGKVLDKPIQSGHFEELLRHCHRCCCHWPFCLILYYIKYRL